MKPRAASARAALTLLLLWGVASCDEGHSILFPPAASLEISFTSQVTPLGQAGEILGVPLRVEVRDEYGNPVPNVEVLAAVTGGDGVLPGGRYQSNRDGFFTIANWRMGERPGPNRLTFEAPGVAATDIEVSSGPGPAASLAVIGPPPAPAQVTSTLTNLPRLRLTDQFDNPVPGASITFTVNPQGTLAQDEGVTDASGELGLPAWTLGETAGTHQLSARFDHTLVTHLQAEARPGPAEVVAWQTEGGVRAEVGLLLPIQPALKVQDRWGNGLAGFEVQFRITAGGGTISTGTAETDAQGIARVDRWTLGAAPGPNRLEARVDGFPPQLLEAEAMDPSWEPEGRYFRVSHVHVNQATQRMDGGVGLVADRPGLLRVFVESSELEAPPPTVEVVLYAGGEEVARERLTAQSSEVPTTIRTDGATTSWNLVLDAARIRPGLGVRVEIDPDGEVGVVTRRFGTFPADGSIHTFDDLVNLPLFHVRFMAMRDAASGTTSTLTAQNVPQFMDFTRRALPVGRDSAYYAGVFTTDLYDAQGRVHTPALGALLNHYLTTRDEIGDHYLHGIFPSSGPLAFAGVAYLPPSQSNTSRQVAMTYDQLPAASATVAHELGHNLDLLHAPCAQIGVPPSTDENFPYANATLGVTGWDRGAAGTAFQRPELARDLMSYCQPRWISDYNYELLRNWRVNKPVPRASAFALPGGAAGSDRILVSGTISSAGVELNPVVATRASPQPPTVPGPYQLVGTADDGTELFRHGFAPTAISHAPDTSEAHFAYVLALPAADHVRLASVRVETPEAGFRGAVQQRPGAGLEPASAQRSRVDDLPEGLRSPSAGVQHVAGAGPAAERLLWDDAVFPMVTVWDEGSGAMVGLLRGGSLRLDLWEGRSVRFQFEDGLRSFDFVDGTLRPLR